MAVIVTISYCQKLNTGIKIWATKNRAKRQKIINQSVTNEKELIWLELIEWEIIYTELDRLELIWMWNDQMGINFMEINSEGY